MWRFCFVTLWGDEILPLKLVLMSVFLPFSYINELRDYNRLMRFIIKMNCLIDGECRSLSESSRSRQTPTETDDGRMKNASKPGLLHRCSVCSFLTRQAQVTSHINKRALSNHLNKPGTDSYTNGWMFYLVVSKEYCFG